ncbi:MAG TPA: sugar phosphate isomerase/epimerase family protein [Planctomycetota bacterium]|nr:sugar phosphate isomerase/epimerase family protein [Planctomycetota bacterium]
MDTDRGELASLFSRREWIKYGALLGTSFAGTIGAAAAGDVPLSASPLQRSSKRYEMKKSINLWAFPYPEKMTLEDCFRLARRAGFDGVEVNYNLEGDLSPAAGEKELVEIRKLSEKTGIAISGVCSFLFWPYPLTAGSEATRAKGLEIARRMIHAAHHLGTDNLLVVPGAVYIPWRKDSEEVPYHLCDERARAAVRQLLPDAEKLGVHLNIENIFFNAYLMSPRDMIEFVDSFQSPNVRVHFDTGNIMPFQFPEHWIPLLGKRIKNIHFKEYSKKGTDFSLESFRCLLDGTTNWPAVMEALDETSYRGYLTFEYFHPFAHYPEALVHQASDALDRMLGRTPASG